MPLVTNSVLPHAFALQDERFHRAFAILQKGIDERAFPGASLAITHQGRLVALKGLGRFTYESSSPEATPESIYDLASLTKAVATTAACMALHEQGKLRLEQKVGEFLPEFVGRDPQRAEVSLQMLLAHSSGLPAYIKLFKTAHNREQLLEQALKVALTAKPGARAEYSDIGFILLGEIVEKLAGEPLDVFCRRTIFVPLGLAHMTYRPPAEWKTLIPPTENDSGFRKKIIQGEVNDENAWVMDGVAGHAGCFATAHDVALVAECMLRGGAPLFQAHTVGLFTRKQQTPPDTSRALGWDTPSAPSQSGSYFSPASYGHLGYTGTSLWIDPERRLSVTLLTNRTWPDRSAQGIKQIRPAFHDAVIEALN